MRDRDWSGFSIVHFGVHALLNTNRPAFSGVVLTMVSRKAQPQNGVLWLNDLYNLRMPVNLVVLSGCHTANGREIPGEGLEGLSRAFFAGARSVVGSLWSVEDRETSLLMEKFYGNLIREKLSPAGAFRRAQLATAKVASTSVAPYYWAGFTVQGERGQALQSQP